MCLAVTNWLKAKLPQGTEVGPTAASNVGAISNELSATSATVLKGTTILELGTIGGGLTLSSSSMGANSKDFRSSPMR